MLNICSTQHRCTSIIVWARNSRTPGGAFHCSTFILVSSILLTTACCTCSSVSPVTEGPDARSLYCMRAFRYDLPFLPVLPFLPRLSFTLYLLSLFFACTRARACLSGCSSRFDRHTRHTVASAVACVPVTCLRHSSNGPATDGREKVDASFRESRS